MQIFQKKKKKDTKFFNVPYIKTLSGGDIWVKMGKIETWFFFLEYLLVSSRILLATPSSFRKSKDFINLGLRKLFKTAQNASHPLKDFKTMMLVSEIFSFSKEKQRKTIAQQLLSEMNQMMILLRSKRFGSMPLFLLSEILPYKLLTLESQFIIFPQTRECH